MILFRTANIPGALFVAGLILLVSGVLTPASALDIFSRTIPILVFVIAMTVVTELAYDAGLFTVVTARLARWGIRRNPGAADAATHGQVFVLWLLVLALTALCTVFLSLDTTAVLMTPVVVTLARQVRISPLPLALTTVWLANTASLLLPVSNLTNLLAQRRMDTTPLEFLSLLWAPALVGVVGPAIFVLLMFWKQLLGKYTAPVLPAVPDRVLLVLSGVTVVMLLPALLSGVLVAIPASIAAIFLLVAFAIRRPSTVRWSMVPFQPVMLAMGLFLVVAALHDHGLSGMLAPAAGSGDGFASLLRLAGVGALGANSVNNLPAYLALEPIAGSPVRMAALLIGVNLGPLISPWASLATLLWHNRLKSMGISINWGGFALAGLALVLIIVPTSVLALWLTAGMPS